MIMGNPYSNLKIFHHTEKLEAIRNGEQPAPVYIRLKPTNLCNHHCAYCTYGSGSTDRKTENRDDIDHHSMIPWEKLREIIEDMGEIGVKAVTLSGGGEPLIYPHILDALQLFREKGIELSLISNGELLAGEIAEELYQAKWVRISFDSPNEEEYCTLRNLQPQSFRRVIKNLEEFSRNKCEDCVLGINFVVGKANSHRVYEAAKLLKELGADNVKFAALIDNSPGYHREIKDSVLDQIRRAKEELESSDFRIFNNYENDWMDKNFSEVPLPHCYTCRLVTVIAADQRVYLCHTRAYDSGAVVGDLSKSSLKELWFSEETKRKLADLNPSRECRNFCVYEDRNRLIQSYFDTNQHINFI